MSPSMDIEAQQRSEEAEAAWAIEARIKRAMSDGRQALWDLADALYEFDEARGWLALGYEKLSDWLADPEVTMTMGTYRRYVRTWRKLVIEKQVEPDRLRQLEQSKVAIVVDKIANNEVLVDDAFADVESLGAGDLREKYYNRRESEPVPEPQPSEVQQAAEEYGVIEGTATEVVVDEVDEALTEHGVTPADDSTPTRNTPEYDYPGWVTEGAVQGLIAELNSGIDSGAGFPRIGRRPCQVALELAKAWLTTQGS